MNKDFKDKKYCLIKNCINEEIRDFITQYALFDEMQDYTPDKFQVVSAHSKYADPAMESLLLKLLPLIEENTGLELYPTYSFYRVYRNGDILHPHKDRPSCEISVTVCLNYSYDNAEYSWPIIMDGNEIFMEPGDIVIYKGVELEHSREKFLPKKHEWHVQAFLHYVDSNGEYSEYKYDKRNSIGENSLNKEKAPYHKSYIISTESS